MYDSLITGRDASERTTAVICAMEEELVHLRLALGPGEETWRGNRRYWLAAWRQRPLIMAICGIGMASAAAATEALILTHSPAAVLNYGCAGAHRADLLPGDVVIGESVVAPQSLTLLPDGAEHYTGIFCAIDSDAKPVEVLHADRALLEAVERAAQDWQPERWPEASRDWRPPVVHRGIVASADCWTQHGPRLAALHDRHGSLCEDMEAAALAQVCTLWQIPFATVKDISNNELLAVTELNEIGPTLEAHFDEIGARAWTLLRRALQSIP